MTSVKFLTNASLFAPAADGWAKARNILNDNGGLVVLRTSNNLSDLTDINSARINLQLRPGTDIQPFSDKLTAYAGGPSPTAIALSLMGKTTAQEMRELMNAGSVTSIAVTGGTTGLQFTGGTVTTAGTFTLGGTLAITNGGTGATTLAGFKTNLGLGNVDNTADADKPVSTAQLAALNAKMSIPTGTTAQYVRGDGTLAAFPTVPSGGIGSVKSVAVSGGTTGLAFTGGPVTESGTLTMDGTLSLANGGTGVTTINALRTLLSINNVDNTSDASKPVSTATASALSTKENTIILGTTAQYLRGDKTWQTLNATAVGLGSVNNTADIDKPISTAVQTALDRRLRIPASLSAGSTLELPTPVGNKYLAWNSTGTAIVNVDGGTGGGSDPNPVFSYLDIEQGDGVETNFTLSENPLALENITIVVGGVPQTPGDAFTWGGGTEITFTEAPPAGAKIVIRYLRAVLQTRLAADFIDTANFSGTIIPDAATVQTALQSLETAVGANSTTLAGKQDTIPTGTTAQYYRGDKTWQTLNKADVGLGNVDNTSDANKPISTATSTALAGKEPTLTAGTTAQYYRGDKTWQTLNKAAVGLGNVDNTADSAKPISTATQTALDRTVKVHTSYSGAGISLPLPEANKVLAWDSAATAMVNIDPGMAGQALTYIDMFTGDGIQTVFNLSVSPGTINNLLVMIGGVPQYPTDNYTWSSGVALTTTSPVPAGVKMMVRYIRATAVGETIASLVTTTNFTGSTIPDGSTVQQAIQSLETAVETKEASLPAGGTSVHYLRGDKTWQTLGKVAVGLGNVDNTSDANKPISTLTQTALDNKQPLHANLTALAGLTFAADQLIYLNASSVPTLTALTAYGRTVMGLTSAAAHRTTLALGTSATVNTGTSGATIPLLNGTNTWSGAQVITNMVKIGSSIAIPLGSITNPYLAVHGAGASNSTGSFGRWTADAAGAVMAVGKSRSATVGTFATVQSADTLGQYEFWGDNGTAFAIGARISATTREGWTSTANGTLMTFGVVDTGSTTLTNIVQLSSAGFYPVTTNTVSSGSPTNYWSNVYATTITVSDAPTTRTNLGLGTAATANTGTSGGTIPLLNTANTWSGTQTISHATGSSILVISAVDGQQSYVTLRTAGVEMWKIGKNNTANGGANAGSDFNLTRHDDSGALLGTSIFITRANGDISVGGKLQPATTNVYSSGGANNYWSALYATSTYTNAIRVQSNTAYNMGGIADVIQVNGSTNSTTNIGSVRWSADANGPLFRLGKSRGAAAGTYAAVQAADAIGSISFFGDDGTALNIGARIDAIASEAFTSTARGTYLRFQVTTPGSLVMTTPLRLDVGTLTTTGNIIPNTTLTDSLGSSSKYWSNLYVGTLNVSNASASRTNLGLGNVDNTSDVNKPVSTATQTAINNAIASMQIVPYTLAVTSEGQTVFTMPVNPTSAPFVFRGGALQMSDVYSRSGTTLTFTTPVGLDEDILILVIPGVVQATVTMANVVGLQAALDALKALAPIDPRQFGAVGDASADDTSAMQQALTLSKTSGRPVGAAGDFRIDGTLDPAGASIVWNAQQYGRENTTIADWGMVIRHNHPTASLFVPTAGGFKFDGVVFYDPRQPGTSVVARPPLLDVTSTYHAVDVDIQNCVFANMYDIFHTSTNAIIGDWRVKNNRGYAVRYVWNFESAVPEVISSSDNMWSPGVWQSGSIATASGVLYKWTGLNGAIINVNAPSKLVEGFKSDNDFMFGYYNAVKVSAGLLNVCTFSAFSWDQIAQPITTSGTGGIVGTFAGASKAYCTASGSATTSATAISIYGTGVHNLNINIQGQFASGKWFDIHTTASGSVIINGDYQNWSGATGAAADPCINVEAPNMQVVFKPDLIKPARTGQIGINIQDVRVAVIDSLFDGCARAINIGDCPTALKIVDKSLVVNTLDTNSFLSTAGAKFVAAGVYDKP